MQRTAAAALLLSISFDTASANEWRLNERKDPFTDEVRREVCTKDSAENELCFWFFRAKGEGHGFWVSLSLPDSETRMIDLKRIPWLRIDGRQTHDWSEIEAEATVRMTIIPRKVEPRWLMWRVSVQSAPNDASIATNQGSVLWQVMHGEKLLVRTFLTGGFQKDSGAMLAGLADLLRQISPMTLGEVRP